LTYHKKKSAREDKEEWAKTFPGQNTGKKGTQSKRKTQKFMA
jgi:hypothetical protein